MAPRNSELKIKGLHLESGALVDVLPDLSKRLGKLASRLVEDDPMWTRDETYLPPDAASALVSGLIHEKNDINPLKEWILGHYKPAERLETDIPEETLYVIESNGHYKIGHAKDLKKRLEKLSCGNPMTLEVLYTAQTPNVKKIEQHLHKKFASKRIKGEWFDLTEEDLQEIQNLSPFRNNNFDIK